MNDNLEAAALRAILIGDNRLWPRAFDRVDVVAELHVPRSSSEVARLSKEVDELGFECTIAERLALSESAAATAAEILVLTIKGLGGIGGAVIAVKAALELPEKLRQLREVLRPYFVRARTLSPVMQLDVVNAWLDSKYGAKKWRYDPEEVEVKEIADLAVYLLKEDLSGSVHLLAVRRDGTIDALPLEYLPARMSVPLP